MSIEEVIEFQKRLQYSMNNFASAYERSVLSISSMVDSANTGLAIAQQYAESLERAQKIIIAHQQMVGANIKRIQEITESFSILPKLAILQPWTMQIFNYKGILDALSLLSKPEFMEEPEWKKFEYNWLGFLTIPEIKDFYQKWKEGKENEIREYFFRMFDSQEKIENLLGKLSGNKIFDERMIIIRDALEAHMKGKFTLSIPVLFSQIDGIFIESHKDIECYSAPCPQCNHTEKISPNAKQISRKLLEKAGQSRYIAEFLEFVIEKYGPRSEILHGLSKDYADRDLSTKLILALYELRLTMN
ncbi:MAG: hypothetical protein MUP55_02070 [Candidatus Aenigmarchaeota archaeon]|nr:hypothetical protein [Candidatus Aenigmarchaeota archaeon]